MKPAPDTGSLSVDALLVVGRDAVRSGCAPRHSLRLRPASSRDGRQEAVDRFMLVHADREEVASDRLHTSGFK